MTELRGRWDVLCRAVDNFGDVGVCWRVARQLARDHGQEVRFWTDAPQLLARLVPDYAPGPATSTIDGVEVRLWTDPFPEVTPAGIVLETFGCGLPPSYAATMARLSRAPLWINLEHLSAEAWVEGCHGLASRHPQMPLTCHFFFPGFGAGTGGLPRERDLIARRDAFRAGARGRFWGDLGIEPPQPGELTVSLFSYHPPDLAGLLEAWAGGDSRVICLLPESAAVTETARFFGREWQDGRAHRGRLEARALPFLPQTGFDELLWACDLNFVRGEDSFVRAQWAAKPFVWQIYPQADGAHWKKLWAFFDGYAAGLEPQAREALQSFWDAWNRGSGAAGAWRRLAPALSGINSHATLWAGHLAGQTDLVTELVQFASERLK